MIVKRQYDCTIIQTKKRFPASPSYYRHPLSNRRKNPHFPERGQKKFNPKRPHLVGGFTVVDVGDETFTGVDDGTLVIGTDTGS